MPSSLSSLPDICCGLQSICSSSSTCAHTEPPKRGRILARLRFNVRRCARSAWYSPPLLLRPNSRLIVDLWRPRNAAISLLLYPACFSVEIWYRSCWLSCVYVFIGAPLINGFVTRMCAWFEGEATQPCSGRGCGCSSLQYGIHRPCG